MKTVFQNWKTLALLLVFLLVVLFMFRAQISKQLEGAQNVKVGPSGVEITAKTPIGEVPNTAPPKETTASEREKCNTARTYCDLRHGFLISVPNANWTVAKDLPAQQHLTYAITESTDVPVYMTKSNQPSPVGVAVGVYPPKNNVSDVQTWVNGYTKNIQKAIPGTQVTTPGGIDTKNNTAVLLTEFPSGGVIVKRFALHNGRAYTLSTTRLDRTTMTNQNNEDLVYILSSFTFLI